MALEGIQGIYPLCVLVLHEGAWPDYHLHNSARCTRNILCSVSGIGTAVVGTDNVL